MGHALESLFGRLCANETVTLELVNLNLKTRQTFQINLNGDLISPHIIIDMLKQYNTRL